MTTHKQQLAKHRSDMQRLIEAKGLRIETLPSGRIRVSGPGVDMHVVDLAYLNSFDLLPAKQ
jgi:hypothetical protein